MDFLNMIKAVLTSVNCVDMLSQPPRLAKFGETLA